MRLILGWLVMAGVAVILLGLANVALVSEGELGSDYQRREARVARRSWPDVVFQVGLKEYTLRQWIPLPWWSEGNEVGLWVNEDGVRAVPEFGVFHPLLMLLYGFLLAMGAVGGLAFLPSEFANYQPRPVEWPVVLQVDRGRAWTGTWVSLGLVGWVVYDWWDTRSFDWAADLTRLLMGALLGIASAHWLSGKITVTPDEIHEKSWVRDKRCSLREVKSAAVELVRGDGPKKPLLGSKLVLRDGAGKEVYSFPDLLMPSEKMWDLTAYLKERFRV